MEQEYASQDYSNTQFDFGTMMDQPGDFALDVVVEEDEKSVKKDSRGFIITGLLSVLAGAGIIVAANTNLGLTETLPYFIGGGIAALGFGLIKAFRKVFSRKKLNLPSLTLRRKVSRQSPNYQQVNQRPNFSASYAANAARSSFRSAKEAAQAASSTIIEAQKGKKLGKSYQNKVFMGVASGLAEYAGVSPGIIRLIFMVSFFFSAGLVALLYGFLGIVLPQKSPNTTR